MNIYDIFAIIDYTNPPNPFTIRNFNMTGDIDYDIFSDWYSNETLYIPLYRIAEPEYNHILAKDDSHSWTLYIGLYFGSNRLVKEYVFLIAAQNFDAAYQHVKGLLEYIASQNKELFSEYKQLERSELERIGTAINGGE